MIWFSVTARSTVGGEWRVKEVLLDHCGSILLVLRLLEKGSVVRFFFHAFGPDVFLLLFDHTVDELSFVGFLDFFLPLHVFLLFELGQVV